MQDWEKLSDEEKVNQLKKGLDAYVQVFKPACQLVTEFTNYKYGFDFGELCPTENHSDEDPPKLIRESDEVIPIDECLGLYDHRKLKITIFTKGIARATQLVQCNDEDLTYIVKLHEWSHALIHIGLNDEDRKQLYSDENFRNPFRRKANRSFQAIDKKLHEHFAQLFTYHILKNLNMKATEPRAKEVLERIMGLFKKLSRFQHYEYRVDDYLETNVDRIVQSVVLLKKELLRGKFEAWETVIKW